MLTVADKTSLARSKTTSNDETRRSKRSSTVASTRASLGASLTGSSNPKKRSSSAAEPSDSHKRLKLDRPVRLDLTVQSGLYAVERLSWSPAMTHAINLALEGQFPIQHLFGV